MRLHMYRLCQNGIRKADLFQDQPESWIMKNVTHFYWEPGNILFSEIKTELYFVNMEDHSRLSWLFTDYTFKLARKSGK